MFKLIKGGCFECIKRVDAESVDLILTDPPYGTMNTMPGYEWDIVIEPKKIYELSDRILRKNGKLVLFGQEPFTNRLICEITKSFSFNYKAIWKKNTFGLGLSAKKAMVNYYEDILIFTKINRKKEINGQNEVRDYFLGERKKTELTYKQINEKCFGSASSGGGLASNILTAYKKGWEFPTKKRYKALQKIGICSKPYEGLKEKSDKFRSDYLKLESEKYPAIFNLWEGKRHKSNILEYDKDYTRYHHPAQKPILLLEDLIKTFSNETDLVVDFTMGSGSTGVACLNTGRNFIGIEKDPKYFEMAKERINKTIDEKIECIESNIKTLEGEL